MKKNKRQSKKNNHKNNKEKKEESKKVLATLDTKDKKDTNVKSVEVEVIKTEGEPLEEETQLEDTSTAVEVAQSEEISTVEEVQIEEVSTVDKASTEKELKEEVVEILERPRNIRAKKLAILLSTVVSCYIVANFVECGYLYVGNYTDYKIPTYKGIELKDVTVAEVTEEEIEGEVEWRLQPEKISDATVQKVSEISETVKEYNEEVGDILRKQNETSRINTLKEKAWEVLLNDINVTIYPRFKIEEISNMVLKEIEENAILNEQTLEEYMKWAGYEGENFDTYVLEKAQERYRIETFLNTIIEKENLELSSEEMDGRILEYVKILGFDTIELALEENYTLEELVYNIQIETVLDYVVEHANIS